MKLREIGRSTSLGLLVLASFFVATQGSALTLDWTEIGWDPADISGLQEFSNVDADPFHESIGFGFQNHAEYGTVVSEYRDDAIRSISFKTDTDNYILDRKSHV